MFVSVFKEGICLILNINADYSQVIYIVKQNVPITKLRLPELFMVKLTWYAISMPAFDNEFDQLNIVGLLRLSNLRKRMVLRKQNQHWGNTSLGFIEAVHEWK